jgi:hypothetical protein
LCRRPAGESQTDSARRSAGAVVPRDHRKHHRPRPHACGRAEVSGSRFTSACPKRFWSGWILIRYRRRHGPIRSRIAARFDAAPKRYSRAQVRSGSRMVRRGSQSHGYDCNHPEVHLTPTGSDREAARTIISVGLSTGSLTEASWQPPRVVLLNLRLFLEMQWGAPDRQRPRPLFPGLAEQAILKSHTAATGQDSRLRFEFVTG